MRSKPNSAPWIGMSTSETTLTITVARDGRTSHWTYQTALFDRARRTAVVDVERGVLDIDQAVLREIETLYSGVIAAVPGGPTSLRVGAAYFLVSAVWLAVSHARRRAALAAQQDRPASPHHLVRHQLSSR